MFENAGLSNDPNTGSTIKHQEMSLLADFQLALVGGGGGAASLD